MTYHRDRPHDWRELAACVGQGELFESVDPVDHLEARSICDTCPALAFAGCQRLAADLQADAATCQTTIVGTWAGELHGKPRTFAHTRGRRPTNATCGRCDVRMIPTSQKPGPDEQHRARVDLCVSCYHVDLRRTGRKVG